MWSPALITQPAAVVDATTTAAPGGETVAASQPYEIKFTVEGGAPVDDDFVEVST